MFMNRKMMVVVASLLLATVSIPFIWAAGNQGQPPAQGPQGGFGGGQGGQRGQGGQGGQIDFQARMLEMAKTQLNATDAEWAKIEPPLKKVMTLSNQANARGLGMAGRGSRQGGQGQGQGGQAPDQQPAREQSEVQKASAALTEVLQNESATAEEVTAKLTALRTAKEAAQKELAAAQAELKKTVNVRQEARLVLMGMLN
ncbi:MAG TPA: hypothetical protein PKB02_11330 [Anaerohalosphaeraceae bacterium]|nr:hypothetical protein [Anaerohalosphaeraceae bacterium]